MFDNTRLEIDSVYINPNIVDIRVLGNGDKLNILAYISLRGIEKQLAKEITKRFNSYNSLKRIAYGEQMSVDINSNNICKFHINDNGRRGCSCNNDPYDLGECVYKDGIKVGTASIDCKYYRW